MASYRKPAFYQCRDCGNLVQLLHGGGKMVCNDEPMEELVPNSTDAAQEKHVPDVSVDAGQIEVRIGDVEHPMIDSHYIEWIHLVTEAGEQHAWLAPSDEPKAVFALGKAKPLAVYAYCNIHGLWVKEL